MPQHAIASATGRPSVPSHRVQYIGSGAARATSATCHVSKPQAHTAANHGRRSKHPPRLILLQSAPVAALSRPRRFTQPRFEGTPPERWKFLTRAKSSEAPNVRDRYTIASAAPTSQFRVVPAPTSVEPASQPASRSGTHETQLPGVINQRNGSRSRIPPFRAAVGSDSVSPAT
jgi:hypothetical protein